MISFDAQGLHILALVFRWYAILTVAGVALAAEVAARLAARVGQDGEHVWRGLIWVIPCALVGARAWFVLFPPISITDNGLTAGWLLTHFFDLNQGAIAVWAGGLSLIGAVAGGLLGFSVYARHSRLPLPIWLDIAAVVLPLVQAVVCVAEALGETLYGPPTTLPWGVLIDDAAQRIGPYRDLARYPLLTTRFQPAAIYELLVVSVLFAMLLMLFLRYRQRFQPGDIALLYVMQYGAARFLLELIRANVLLVGGVNVSQVVAGLAVIGAIFLLRRRTRRPDRPLYQIDLVAQSDGSLSNHHRDSWKSGEQSKQDDRSRGINQGL